MSPLACLSSTPGLVVSLLSILGLMDIPSQDLLDLRIASTDQIRPAALDDGADFCSEKIADIGVRLSRVFVHRSLLLSAQNSPATEKFRVIGMFDVTWSLTELGTESRVRMGSRSVATLSDAHQNAHIPLLLHAGSARIAGDM
jgi:hypothetical protein